jgi:hypothetical protein
VVFGEIRMRAFQPIAVERRMVIHRAQSSIPRQSPDLVSLWTPP